MKAVLVGLGGSVLVVSTFLGGMVSATAMFSAHPEPGHLAGANVSDIWTSTPVRVDAAAQSLQRVPAQLPYAEQATGASAATGEISAARNPSTGQLVDARIHDDGASSPEPKLFAEHLEWCASRYRSYSPRDNSYTSFRGSRRQCSSPYQDLPMATHAVPKALTKASSGDPLSREQLVADLGPSANPSDKRLQSCPLRYRSYRVEDNTYQPAGGGPRRQCQ